jgi:hypothetical protein
MYIKLNNTKAEYLHSLLETGALPSDCTYNTLGKGFAECLRLYCTRQRLCRVPYSAKPTWQKRVSAKTTLPSAFYRALDKVQNEKIPKKAKKI